MLDLKPAIRQRSEVALAALLQNLVEQKPEGHELDSRPDLRTPVRMSAIGG
jgi:molybdenum cofactor biosynthesis enzyme MoaA